MTKFIADGCTAQRSHYHTSCDTCSLVPDDVPRLIGLVWCNPGFVSDILNGH